MESKRKLNQKKLLMVAPVFVLLVCAGVFHALGGGNRNHDTPLVASGFNRSLPDADLKSVQPEDKLGIYELSDRDSARFRSRGISSGPNDLGFNDPLAQDPTRQINSKLEALNKELNRPQVPMVTPYTSPGATSVGSNSGMKTDVDRLEALMKTMQQDKGEDPEVSQLNGMLDKILSIQNPQLVQQQLRSKVNLGPDSQFRAVPAVLVDKQKVGQGASVKLRLLDTMRISGLLIPKGHELFALSRLVNHRLLLDISNIRLGTSIVPVKLSVYSLDGMPGIDAPEAELGNAASSGVDDAVRGMQFLSMDQSIGLQAAGAGIDAAKSLLSRKVRKIRVPLKAGLQVLLRNNDTQKY